MRRFLSLAVILGVFSPVALVGCGEENKVQTQEKVTTPGGTTTTTETKSEKSTGSNPPATTEGQAPVTKP
jgi:hypothetical protein